MHLHGTTFGSINVTFGIYVKPILFSLYLTRRGLTEQALQLESTIISHGMPYPKNARSALKVLEIIRDNGAIPELSQLLTARCVPVFPLTRHLPGREGPRGC